MLLFYETSIHHFLKDVKTSSWFAANFTCILHSTLHVHILCTLIMMVPFTFELFRALPHSLVSRTYQEIKDTGNQRTFWSEPNMWPRSCTVILNLYQDKVCTIESNANTTSTVKECKLFWRVDYQRNALQFPPAKVLVKVYISPPGYVYHRITKFLLTSLSQKQTVDCVWDGNLHAAATRTLCIVHLFDASTKH